MWFSKLSQPFCVFWGGRRSNRFAYQSPHQVPFMNKLRTEPNRISASLYRAKVTLNPSVIGDFPKYAPNRILGSFKPVFHCKKMHQLPIIFGKTPRKQLSLCGFVGTGFPDGKIFFRLPHQFFPNSACAKVAEIVLKTNRIRIFFKIFRWRQAILPLFGQEIFHEIN